MEQRELRGIEVRTLVTEPRFVALPDWDPLGEQEEVDLAPPAEQVGQRVRILQACADAGFTPRLAHHVNEAGTARGLVAGGAVSFAAAPSRSGDGIVIRPLRSRPTSWWPPAAKVRRRAAADVRLDVGEQLGHEL